MRSRTFTIVLLAVLAASSLSSCADAVCGRGEHPVRWIEDHNGSVCVKDGEPPPPGYEEYPEGATPTKA